MKKQRIFCNTKNLQIPVNYFNVKQISLIVVTRKRSRKWKLKLLALMFDHIAHLCFCPSPDKNAKTIKKPRARFYPKKWHSILCGYYITWILAAQTSSMCVRNSWIFEFSVLWCENEEWTRNAKCPRALLASSHFFFLHHVGVSFLMYNLSFLRVERCTIFSSNRHHKLLIFCFIQRRWQRWNVSTLLNTCVHQLFSNYRKFVLVRFGFYHTLLSTARFFLLLDKYSIN